MNDMTLPNVRRAFMSLDRRVRDRIVDDLGIVLSDKNRERLGGEFDRVNAVVDRVLVERRLPEFTKAVQAASQEQR